MTSLISLTVALLLSLLNAFGERPGAQSPTAAVEEVVFDALHAGHVLCIHQDVPPVSRFFHDYTDPMGNHFHGWLPPVGTPFYVECFDALER